jgi:hypothetical protein
VHNSGWVKSPGYKIVKDRSQWGRLQDYVCDIVSVFGADERVVLWDLYNEPGNSFLVSLSQPPLLRYAKIILQLVAHLALPNPVTPLLRDIFSWARSAQPDQPLTTGLWYMRANLSSRLNWVALELSDVVSFHSYFAFQVTTRLVTELRQTGRPLLCTEYLARGAGCTLEDHLPYFQQQKIGCHNWGLVSGKTQTMYSWEDHYPSGEEPSVWYHDLLRPDGMPYRQEEADLIRKVTSLPKSENTG